MGISVDNPQDTGELSHLISCARRDSPKGGYRIDRLGDGRGARVAGLVTCRQRPMTASGVAFLTLEDESGMINVLVWPTLGERQRPMVRRARLLGVVGHVQASDAVIHLIAHQLTDLSHWLQGLETMSRDFT